MPDLDPESAVCFKKFEKCCFCLDLKVGAHILGIFATLSGIYGIVAIILYFGNPSWAALGIACLALCNVVTAIAYIMMLISDSSESKNRFALWYLLGFGAGCICYAVFTILAGAILIGIIAPLISLCIVWYFYCCIKSYAAKVF